MEVFEPYRGQVAMLETVHISYLQVAKEGSQEYQIL